MGDENEATRKLFGEVIESDKVYEIFREGERVAVILSSDVYQDMVDRIQDGGCDD